MKKILIIILGLIGFAQAQVNVAGYIQTNGVASYPTHIDSMGKGGYVVVYDTTQRNSITCLRRKFGMAVYTQKDTTLWILRDSSCNNNWIAFTSGISSVDSLVYATKANVIKVRDSLLAADNFWSGENRFSNILKVDNQIKVGLESGTTGSIKFYNQVHTNTATIFASDTLATDVDIELPTSSGKLALTTDIAIVDTSIISTKAYVDYKDDIQQGFIDMRKLDSDSSADNGYTSRARLKQYGDSLSAAQAVINGVQDDSLLAHNTRTLANQNAINSLDALVVKLGGSQTITGDKVTTGLFTARVNGLATTPDLTKGIRLENLTATTSVVPLQNSPSLFLRGNVWNTGLTTGGISAGDNLIEWGINTSGLSGNTVNNMDAYLDINMRWGSNSPIRVARFTKAGLETNLFQNTLTLGQPGNTGTLTLNRSSGGSSGTISGQPAGLAVSSGVIFLSTSGYIQMSNGASNGSRFSISTGLLIQPDANAAANSASRLSVVGNASIGANVAAPTNGLQVAGETKLTGLNTDITTKTADYTALTTDHTILVDATSNNVTITLPTAVGNSRLYTIKRIDGSVNTVTIATTSSQTIDGSTTYTGLLTQYQTVAVQSNSSHYFITSKF